jgi:hypothetical protein
MKKQFTFELLAELYLSSSFLAVGDGQLIRVLRLTARERLAEFNGPVEACDRCVQLSTLPSAVCAMPRLLYSFESTFGSSFDNRRRTVMRSSRPSALRHATPCTVFKRLSERL